LFITSLHKQIHKSCSGVYRGEHMERIYTYFSLLSMLFSLYFGGLAAFSFVDENMDKMYLNIGYCALFLSIMIFTLDAKKHKKTDHHNQ